MEANPDEKSDPAFDPAADACPLQRALRPATVLVLLLSTVIGANLFTEPSLLTGGGGPNGASASPVLVMYQQGIQQGKPGYAAAIGVILVVAVVVIAFLQNRFASGRD